jgi:hypothetical protein
MVRYPESKSRLVFLDALEQLLRAFSERYRMPAYNGFTYLGHLATSKALFFLISDSRTMLFQFNPRG